MTRRLVIAAFVLALVAGIASSGMFKSERATASANATITTASPAFGLCDSPFVKNVRVKDLGKSAFEVTWDFTAPDPCLKSDGFEVVVSVKRKVGGGLLGQKTIKAGPLDRRAIFNFASVFVLDQVTASVSGTITLKSFLTAGLDL